MNAIRAALDLLYDERHAQEAEDGIRALIDDWAKQMSKAAGGWSQRDAFLITYGDSLLAADRAPIDCLHDFLRQEVGDLISMVHILPFCPYSSDDGFSVIDYRQIDPTLGTWRAVEDLAADYRLCADFVINHVSQESAYVQGHLAGDPAYQDFAIEVDPNCDLSQVVRPRTSPLLHAFTKADGSTAHLWTTFSRDQVDLNLGNPRVLIELMDVLLSYAAHGAQVIRLDAIAFLWKQMGTACLHLPQTHAVVRLMRAVADAACPHLLLLSETNVPHQENMSYFGDPPGVEAQIIYNFSLAPLTLYALVAGDAGPLSAWARAIRFVSPRCTFLNMTATHDGIGMRPTEGLLDEEGRMLLCDIAAARGGTVSYKSNPDGSQTPYELNINYFDAINDPDADEPLTLQIERFLAAQTILLSFIGIPSFYIHSLIGSRNWRSGWQESGIPRRINREKLCVDQLRAELANPQHRRHQVFQGLARLLRIRAGEPCFHPDADQLVHELTRCAVVIERHGKDGERLLALINISATSLSLPLPPGFAPAHDLLAEDSGIHDDLCELAPYQARWLKVAP